MARLPEAAVRALVVSTILPAMRPNGTPEDQEMFVELARFESNFDTNAIGPKGEVGLWQIHPINWESLGATKESLQNPFTNAKAAATIWNKQGWAAWTTRNKAMEALNDRGILTAGSSQTEYEDWVTERMGDVDFGPLDVFLNPVETAQKAAEASGIDGVLGAVGKFFAVITSVDFWKRVGLGALGAAIIILAFMMFTRAGSMVSSVATKGAVK